MPVFALLGPIFLGLGGFAFYAIYQDYRFWGFEAGMLFCALIGIVFLALGVPLTLIVIAQIWFWTIG